MIIDSHYARKAALLAGLPSVAMIGYLERTGVFVPTKRRPKHRGTRRKYTFRDILVLKTIATLLRNGASVAALKSALEGLQRLPWKAEETVLEDKAGPIRHLVVSSQRIYLVRSKDELIDLAAGNQLSFSFLIDLEKLHTELAQEWRQERLQFSH
ncbi:MAG: MerR family transcriptional regulator [Sphingomonas sp.]|uniref:MerR family transcriptional regulator n=1 Tax=Sphingomonas sp. TaxID=28214 RepID=UPI00120EA321|nr:MerR family transcriptional regulator [Sphingomonas sp.]THD35967.1 MAG: MerR family transcriptional regulator [Sphingomonas sp.]